MWALFKRASVPAKVDERSLGPGAWDPGPGTQGLGPRAWDPGSGTQGASCPIGDLWGLFSLATARGAAAAALRDGDLQV